MKRQYSTTPEDRAIVLMNQRERGVVSGHTYISAVLEGRQTMIPYIKNTDRLKCDHAFAMCAQWECVESWSMDYVVLLMRTVGGRDLAAKLRIDPLVSLHDEHIRVGLVLLKHEDYVIEDPA